MGGASKGEEAALYSISQPVMATSDIRMQAGDIGKAADVTCICIASCRRCWAASASSRRESECSLSLTLACCSSVRLAWSSAQEGAPFLGSQCAVSHC